MTRVMGLGIMNKKAVIVGGSNGIGLAVGQELLFQGYELIIVDKIPPGQQNYKDSSLVSFFKSNLLDFDDELFENLAKDDSIEALIITAGIGRVAEFEYLHIGEIQNILAVNTIATLKILRIFYDRIKNDKVFYTGVMVSIAGHVSSPAFSVYAASKAAIARFIESINIELEIAGKTNRILDVSPGAIKGTCFGGGESDLSLLNDFAKQLVAYLMRLETLFIPQYKDVFKTIINEYQSDSHQYGISSYEYKKKSGRIENKKKAVIGYLSGTFDLFHIGHLNLIRRAKEQCDYLIVGVHESGAWKRKETFIPFVERKKIVAACRYVDKVVNACQEDSDAWNLWHFSKLFVGSDYKDTERFNRYEVYFNDKKVDIIYFPYTETTSSTQIRRAVSRF